MKTILLVMMLALAPFAGAQVKPAPKPMLSAKVVKAALIASGTTHSVLLSWSPSPAACVSTVNIYRVTTPGQKSSEIILLLFRLGQRRLLTRLSSMGRRITTPRQAGVRHVPRRSRFTHRRSLSSFPRRRRLPPRRRI